jgi:hypothetical protein
MLAVVMKTKIPIVYRITPCYAGDLRPQPPVGHILLLRQRLPRERAGWDFVLRACMTAISTSLCNSIASIVVCALFCLSSHD